MKQSSMLAADTVFRVGILATLAGFGWVMWKNRASAGSVVGARRKPSKSETIAALRDSVAAMERAHKELAPLLKHDPLPALAEWRAKNKQTRSIVEEPIPHKYDHIAQLKAWQLKALQSRIRPPKK